jgi:hypothetical protein
MGTACGLAAASTKELLRTIQEMDLESSPTRKKARMTWTNTKEAGGEQQNMEMEPCSGGTE